MPSQPPIQRLYEATPLQMPIVLYPFLDAPTGALQLLASRSLPHFYGPVTVFQPVGFKA